MKLGQCLFQLTNISSKNKIIICFPYAGGSHQAYKIFCQEIKDFASIWVFEPPGHIYTTGEVITDIYELCQQYIAELPKGWQNKEIILLGHSVGSYIACEFASQLNLIFNVEPTLILCAAYSPMAVKNYPPFSSLSLVDLVEVLVKNQCLDEKFLQSPELLEFYSKPLQADFYIYEHFQFPKNITHLNALILCGYEDKMVPAADAFLWKSFFERCTVDFVSGGHLFIKDRNILKQMLNIICNYLEEYEIT